MRKNLCIIFLIIFFIPEFADARRGGRWKRYRYDAVLGFGASNFLGELGGANQIGTDYMKDLELALTRPTIHFGLRYRITEFIALKSGFHFAWIRGNDNTTTEFYRSNRNLHFKSPILEFGNQIEFSWKKEQVGHRYVLRGVKGRKNIELRTYLFVGVAGFWFNPKAEYNGKWYKLRDMHTEGQGIVPTRKPYSRFQLSLPGGLGVNYRLSRLLSISFEVSGRKTFTDYIDDVSTTYFDPERIEQNSEYGSIAKYLADPSLSKTMKGIVNVDSKGNPIEGDIPITTPGQQRGDVTDKDMYMFAVFSINYKLRTSRRNLPSF